MALTRKQLKAMGLTDEQVDSILEGHTETVEGLKAEIAKYRADAEALPEVQKELDKAKADLEAGKKDSFKVKYEALKEEFEGYKTEQTKKESHAAKESAFRALLKEAGIVEKRIDAIVRVSDVDSLELDDKGAAKDGKERIKAIKEEWADFIGTTTTTGASTATPPANTGGTTMTKDEIMNIKDAGERQKAMFENKQLFGIA